MQLRPTHSAPGAPAVPAADQGQAPWSLRWLARRTEPGQSCRTDTGRGGGVPTAPPSRETRAGQGSVVVCGAAGAESGLSDAPGAPAVSSPAELPVGACRRSPSPRHPRRAPPVRPQLPALETDDAPDIQPEVVPQSPRGLQSPGASPHVPPRGGGAAPRHGCALQLGSESPGALRRRLRATGPAGTSQEQLFTPETSVPSLVSFLLKR